jgi:hypothetical protein
MAGARVSRKSPRSRRAAAGDPLRAVIRAIDAFETRARQRVQDQLDKADAERARGNEYGYEWHRAKAADLAALPGLGAPGVISRAARAVEKERQLDRARAKGGAATGAAMKRGAELTKQKVEAAEAAARADGVKPHKLKSEVSRRTGLSRSTVTPYLKK